MSWYRTVHESSIHFIERTGIEKNDWMIDVGAGASTLVDQLIAREYKKIALFDVSSNALARTKSRLGDSARLK